MKDKTIKLGVLVLFTILLTALTSAVVSDNLDVRFANSTTFSSNNDFNKLVNQEPDPVEPGEFVEVRWKVENFGSKNIDNMIIELLPTYPFSLEPGDKGIRKIGSVHGRQIGDEGVIIYYRLKVDEGAEEGNNKIRLRYTTNNGVSYNQFDPFNIRVEPRTLILSVDEIISIPSTLRPGETAKVKIKLLNLANSLIKNIRVNLQLIRPLSSTSSTLVEEIPISPVGSSNEKTIFDLKAREFEYVEFDLIADPDAESGVHKIPLILNYEDKLGNSYNKSSILSLIIGDEPDLIVNIDSSEIRKLRSPGDVTIKFVNKGVTDIKFLYVKVEESDDYEIISSYDNYIGNIDSDDYETADFNLYIHEAEDNIATIPILVEYKDANNQEYMIKKNLQLRLYSSTELKKFGLNSKSGGSGIIIFLLLIAGGVFYYFRWKKKKRKK